MSDVPEDTKPSGAEDRDGGGTHSATAAAEEEEEEEVVEVDKEEDLDDELLDEEDDLDEDDELDSVEAEELLRLERERAELLADLELMRQNFGSYQLETSSMLSASSFSLTETTVISASGENGLESRLDDQENDDDAPRAPEVNPSPLERLKEMVRYMVRILLLILWYWIQSTLHFLILPRSYVQVSMVNVSRRNQEMDARLKKSAMYSFFQAKNYVSLFPRPRVIFTIILGLAFGIALVLKTEDEFLFGPPDPEGLKRVREDRAKEESIYQMEISFENLGCQIAAQKSPILFNVSGSIPPGQITGILGPSGAGKSTFAAGLMGRGERLCSTSFGSVYLNGERRSLNAILDRVGFVPQRDDLFEDLTVAETLRFSSTWRLPWYYTEEDRDKALNETIELLDLQAVRDERIGGLMNRGISGGEKKRVSIGVELIMKPSVLVMDEPTSGLDGASAFKLMKRLRHIVDRTGVSAVVVMHVPSARVFKLIDNLILLQHGELAYQGPSNEVLSTMAQMGFQVPGFLSEGETKGKHGIPTSLSDSNRSSANVHAITIPEYLLDVLAGVEPYPDDLCPYRDMVEMKYEDSPERCHGLETLPMRWRRLRESRIAEKERQKLLDDNEFGKSVSNGPGDSTCLRDDEIEAEIRASFFSESEDDPQLGEAAVSPQKNMDRGLKLGICDRLKNGPRRLCLLLNRRNARTLRAYPRVAKPGLVKQVSLWYVLLLKLRVRKGIEMEVGACIVIAVFCAWIRSYSKGWDARAMAAFFVSVTVSALGCFAAVFEDNVGPVKRAAESGMVLGAHHNAMVALAISKAIVISTVFSLGFHITLWLRSNDLTTLTFKRHFAMTYIITLDYIVNWSIGALLCVLAQHDFQKSCVVNIGYLMWTHVFAMYTPNARQIELDSLLFDRYPVTRFIRIMCSMSPARYFIEAFTLWDSEPARSPSSSNDTSSSSSSSGRMFMLNYFGYKDEDLSTCLNILFTFFLFVVIVRWFVFGFVNSTDFHSLYDTPLFAKFYIKLHLSLSLALAILVTLHKEKNWLFMELQRRLDKNMEQL